MRCRRRTGTASSGKSASSAVLATFYIALAVYQLYLNQWLQIRWRRWMTSRYLGEWLHDANHYRMQLQGDAADNPDQRIADDVKLFVEQTLSISVGLLSAVVTLASFVVILWGLSAEAPLAYVRQRIRDPRLSGMGRADLRDLRNGADALDRLAAGPSRFSSSSALRPTSASTWCGCARTPSRSRCCRARAPNAGGSRERFGRVVENWYDIMSRTKRLTAFTSSYAQAAVIFPYILVAPAYFADKIQLGGMMQTASAFSSVQESLSFFVSIYRTLAEWRAVVARLDGFETAIDSAATLATSAGSIDVVPSTGSDNIDLRAASGQAAQRNAAGLGRRLQHSRQRAHPGHRSVRRRQVDLVPRHRRHLAVRHAARSRSRPRPR